MKKNFNISKGLSKNDIYKDKYRGRLLIYSDLHNDKNKSPGPYYYNEEEKNKYLDNYYKTFNENKKNNIGNKNINIINSVNNNNEIKVKTENKIIHKKNNLLISFVQKDDKNKNLKINKLKEDHIILDLYTNNFKKIDLNDVHTKVKNKNRNLSAKFNEINLEKKKINAIKIISEKIKEKPKIDICFFTKTFKKKDAFNSLIPIIKPKNVISNYDKSYICQNKRLLLPEIDICYFKKTFITYKREYKKFVLNKKYFCTKIKKKSLKHEGKSSTQEEQKNLNNENNKNSKKIYFYGINDKKNNINNNFNNNINNKNNINYNKNQINNKNNINNNDININDKRKNQKNEVNKLKSNKTSLNNMKFQSFKADNQNYMYKKIHNKNKYNRNNYKNNDINKYIANNPIILNKFPKHKKYLKNSNLTNIENGQNNYSSSSSSFDSQKHISLFYYLFGKKENFDEKNKIFLRNHFYKKYYSRNKEALYMPKIYSKSLGFNFKKRKEKISPNIKSSKDLINKINREISLSYKVNKNSRNNNNITSFNSLENNLTYNINNYNQKDLENNLIKNDKSNIYNSTNNLFFSSCKENNTEKKQNISRRLLDMNKDNNIMRMIRNDYNLIPLQNNNRENQFDNRYVIQNFKKNNNKSITLKKINFSKDNEETIKNYKSGLLAIKEYFNIK